MIYYQQQQKTDKTLTEYKIINVGFSWLDKNWISIIFCSSILN